jgi:hypothetical protein
MGCSCRVGEAFARASIYVQDSVWWRACERRARVPHAQVNLARELLLYSTRKDAW